VRTVLFFFILLPLMGCMDRYVLPPTPEDGGVFLVHRVRSSEESFPKVLTWYTGTTLSQQIIVRHNSFVLERELRVGDVIKIPVEVVANDRPYGEESAAVKPPAVDLLMEGASPKESPTPLPESSRLETFDDESSPDRPEKNVKPIGQIEPSPEPATTAGPTPSRIEILQREIREREVELNALKAESPLPEAPIIDAAPTANLEVLD